MALKYRKNPENGTESTMLLGSYLVESAQLKDYLLKMLADYEPSLVSLEVLRQQLGRELKDQSLSDLIRQMREESAH